MNFDYFKSKFQKVPVEHYPSQVPSNPVVSVCVQTYQHGNYIKECIDGILMQETDFSFEILLGEDASTDGTRGICIEYAKKFPGKIRLFLNKRENNIKIGGQPTGRFNFLYNLYNANGKYIALCEGDDYWTDPNKLQEQVEFLENHLDYAGSAHNAVIKYETEDIKPRKFRDFGSDKIFIGTDFLGHRPFHTASFVFRSKIFQSNSFPVDVVSADRVLYLLVSLAGPIFYLNKVMCCYRKNSTGISTRVTPRMLEKDLKIADWFKKRYQNFPKGKYLSFVHLTVLTYSSELNFNQLLHHSFFHVFYSFSYFPHNLKDILSFGLKKVPMLLLKAIKTKI